MRTTVEFWRRHGDLALALLLAAWMSIDLWSRQDGRQWQALLCGGLATLPLSARRRLPLVSFVLVLAGLVSLAWRVPASYNASAPFLVVAVIAPFSVGAHAVGRQFWGSFVALAVAIAVASVAEPTALSVGTVMFFVAFAGTPWACGLMLRLFRERQASERVRTERLLEAEAVRNARALEAERAWVARDLHDVVSHAMAVTVMQARGGRRMLDVDLEDARAAFDAIERTNAQALGDMRRMLRALRNEEDGSPSAPLPSLRRLPELIEAVRASGLQVEMSITGDLEQVPPGVDLSAYRVIQEALTNVLKHAGPARAEVTVECGAEELTLLVSDDGPGASAPSPAGSGLVGIRERVAVLGGAVQAGVGPTGGFTVSVQLPYQVPA